MPVLKGIHQGIRAKIQTSFGFLPTFIAFSPQQPTFPRKAPSYFLLNHFFLV